MKDDKNHLNIDLDFLDKNEAPKAATKSSTSDETPDPKKGSTPPPITPVDTGYKHNWKNIVAIGAIVLFFGWAMFSGNSSSTNISSDSSYTPSTNSNIVMPPIETPIVTADTVTKDDPAVVPKVKTNSQICKTDYGSHSYATGAKNATGGPECDCQSGYEWNTGKTSCVLAPPAPKSNYEICQDRNGPFATYDSASNSCSCASGYSYDATSQQCVSFTVARDLSCSAKYPGTSFLKVDQTDGKNICDCVAGSYWNNERTACYPLSSYTQSCVSSYGTGAYSTTENGKRVCDCGYGYDFNAQRNMCVTTASINAICERDVGRNSRYSGTVTNGKYDCTEPY